MPVPDPNVPLVVLDTNVYISGTTVSSSPPAKIINAWQENKINLALSEPMISEIRDVFSRPYFTSRTGWQKKQLDRYLTNLRLSSLVVPGTTPVNICRDPNDNMVFSCALEARANYIVSGDQDIIIVGVFQNTLVKSPRDFVEEALQTIK